MARNFMAVITASLGLMISILSGCSVHGSAQAQTAATTRASGELGAGSAVECHGGDALTLSDRVIDTAGNAVEAHGACRLTLVRCKLRAGAVAISAHGDSRVIVQDSEIEGGHAAVVLHGASRVELTNARLKGRIEKHGLAKLEDLGGNRFE